MVEALEQYLVLFDAPDAVNVKIESALCKKD